MIRADAVLEQIAQPYLDSPFARASRDYSEATARELDLAVRSLIEETFAGARSILENQKGDLEEGTKLLLERETVTPVDLPAIGRTGPPAEATRVVA